MDKETRRRELSKKAWKEAFMRLFAAAGPDWPIGSDLSSPELMAAETAANKATADYIATGRTGAREALKTWEDLMMVAIRKAKDKRGCSVCGIEKTVEIVDPEGRRTCGRCRAGNQMVDANEPSG